MSSFRQFPDDKTERKHFCCGVFIEVGNFILEACNVREKGTHLRKLLGNFEILEYLSFSSTSRKVSAEELSVWY